MPEDDRAAPIAVSDAPLTGLSPAEVEDRRRRGLVNDVPRPPSRTVRQIVRANVFTRFNAILGALLVVILAVGASPGRAVRPRHRANTAHRHRAGAAGQAHARPAARSSTPRRPRVVRDGARAPSRRRRAGARRRARAAARRPGRWSTARCSQADGLEVDESLLTGEADPVVKRPATRCCPAASSSPAAGACRATGSAPTPTPRKLAERGPPLHAGAAPSCATASTGSSRCVSWLIVADRPIAADRQPARAPTTAGATRSQASVAGLVAMVPEGLVLLTSIAFAVGVIRLAAARCSSRSCAAIEVLARVDVVCLDKTGTLTEGDIDVADVEPLDGRTGRRARRSATSLARLGAADPRPERHASARCRSACPSRRRLDDHRRRRAVLVGPQVERRRLRRPRALGPARRARDPAARRRPRRGRAVDELAAARGSAVLLLARSDAAAGGRRRDGDDAARRRGRSRSSCSRSRCGPTPPTRMRYFARAGRRGQGHLRATTRAPSAPVADAGRRARRRTTPSTPARCRDGPGGARPTCSRRTPCSAGSRRTRSGRWCTPCSRGATSWP